MKVISKKKLKNSLLLFDIVISVLAYFTAFFLVDLIDSKYFGFTGEYVIMLGLIIPSWAILLYNSSFTQIPRTRSQLSIFFNLLNVCFICFILLFLYKHLFGLRDFSHYFIIAYSLVNLFSLYSFRLITYKVFNYYRANGHNISNVILFADDKSDRLIDTINMHKEWGFRILMIITDSALIRKKYGHAMRIYPDKIDIKSILDIDIIDEVIYGAGKIDFARLNRLIRTCKEIGVTFRLQSSLSPISATKMNLTVFKNIPFYTFANTPKNHVAIFWKSFSDFWISLGILVLICPLMLLIAIAIKMTSKGPIIFKQERVGLRGRKFYIYKFRTMVNNAEELKSQLIKLNESDGPVFKIKNDPRITLVGRLLRKTGLDELPQFFNVLKGEMSLIGPRPPLPSEVTKYARWQLRRLSVKPGITCTWQVEPNRHEILFDRWMQMDLHYIDNWSFDKDVKLLFKTIRTVLYGSGA